MRQRIVLNNKIGDLKTMTNKIIYTRKIAMKLIEMGNVPAGTT